jgi:hypothetical protein
MKNRYAVPALALAAAVSLGACAKKEPPAPAPVPTAVPTPVPFKVVSVDLGKSVGEDKKVKDAATAFRAKDTLYVVVSSEGVAARVTLKARLTYGAKLVAEDTRDLAPTGPAVTEFHTAIVPTWPAGKYKVEVTVDGAAVATKDLEIRK